MYIVGDRTPMNKVAQKLTAARTRLILDKPFLGALVLRLPLVEAEGNWCETSATDARSLYYNPNYMAPLNLSQVQFVLAHEALHCGLSHFARRQYRDLHRWNLACDYAVNLLLNEDGLELAPGALLNEEYRGLSAEEIYPFIPKDSNEKTLDQHLYDSSGESNTDQDPNNSQPNSERNPERRPEPKQEYKQGQKPDTQPTQQQQQPQSNQNPNPNQSHSPERNQGTKQFQNSELNNNSEKSSAGAPPNNNDTTKNSQAFRHGEMQDGKPKDKTHEQPPSPLSVQEREKLNSQWQQRLAGAAQQAAMAGKMNGSVERLVEKLLRSTVPWRAVLARFMSASAREDYNLMRPSQRRAGSAILPSLYSRQANILVALDTSGSVEQNELTEFIAEISAIKSLINARITLLACDAQLDDDGPWIFEPWERLELPKSLQGGGNTDFSPVFEWMHQENHQSDLLIYFTDAKGRFPKTPPAIETLWLVKGNAEVPWGQRIQLN